MKKPFDVIGLQIAQSGQLSCQMLNDWVFIHAENEVQHVEKTGMENG